MSVKETVFKCDNCGQETYSQFDFKEVGIYLQGRRIWRKDLCEKCLKKADKYLKNFN